MLMNKYLVKNLILMNYIYCRNYNKQKLENIFQKSYIIIKIVFIQKIFYNNKQI